MLVDIPIDIPNDIFIEWSLAAHNRGITLNEFIVQQLEEKLKEMNNMLSISPYSSWDDADWSDYAEYIRDSLKEHEVTVAFTKKDGTEREMRCTLNPNYLPTQDITESKEPRKKSENTIAVYDLDAHAWRSFTIRSVKKVIVLYNV
jgi:hypothetical protein